MASAMAPKYAKDQPAGFTNRIERVAIVGVSYSPTLLFDSLVITKYTLGNER